MRVLTESQKEKKREVCRKYRAANSEKVRESARKHYAANAEKVREASRNYRHRRRSANPEKAREADRESTRKYRAANPDKVREATRQSVWKQAGIDLTLKEYAEMREHQDYCCAICETPEVQLGRKLGVDHNHTTGDVRGLLCTNCNAALGLLKDSPRLLRTAATYLEQGDGR